MGYQRRVHGQQQQQQQQQQQPFQQQPYQQQQRQQHQDQWLTQVNDLDMIFADEPIAKNGDSADPYETKQGQTNFSDPYDLGRSSSMHRASIGMPSISENNDILPQTASGHHRRSYSDDLGSLLRDDMTVGSNSFGWANEFGLMKENSFTNHSTSLNAYSGANDEISVFSAMSTSLMSQISTGMASMSLHSQASFAGSIRSIRSFKSIASESIKALDLADLRF